VKNTRQTQMQARFPVRSSHQGQETLLLRRIVAEHAGEPAGERHRPMLGDAAHRHAGMLRLDQHGNATGLENLVDRGRDLGGQVLLGLQAAGEDVGQPRQLGQSHHSLHRRIGDMRPAVERHHVVLALRGEFDIANQDEIVIARGFAKGAVQHLGRALVVALIEFVEGFDHPARRIQEALAADVLADIAEQDLHGLFGLRARGARQIGANRSRQELGRIELGRAGLRGHIGRFHFGRLDVRRLDFRSLAGPEGFDQCVHVFSVRPVQKTGVSPGRRGGFAAGRLSPIHKTLAATLVSMSGRLRANGRAVFPPFLSIYRTMKPSRQGRLDRRPGHRFSC
jgi:hypothetical protein